jgi:2Fe-2S ferredoxin
MALCSGRRSTGNIMPQITFVLPDGTEKTIAARAGDSLMEAAVDHDITGIVAECGGGCSCATCHVYIAEDWVGRIEPAADFEKTMHEFAVEPKPTSRLSCQVFVNQEMDGLRVQVPERQY